MYEMISSRLVCTLITYIFFVFLNDIRSKNQFELLLLKNFKWNLHLLYYQFKEGIHGTASHKLIHDLATTL